MLTATIDANQAEKRLQLEEKLGRYYHSEYVRLNRPEVLATPYKEWLRSQFIRLGVDLDVA